jgi:DNA invertase Pin-like site-specific DNA recombinase
MLQNKDDQLAVKDKTISDRDIEITRLKHELLRGKSKDWQHEAIELYKSGVSKAEIAKRLGKGRTTISNYLNKPDIKKLTASI